MIMNKNKIKLKWQYFENLSVTLFYVELHKIDKLNKK